MVLSGRLIIGALRLPAHRVTTYIAWGRHCWRCAGRGWTKRLQNNSLSFGRLPTLSGQTPPGIGGSPRWEWRLPPGEVIVEDYDLVVMASLPKGEHTLRLATCDFGAFGAKTEEWLELAEIRVVD